MMWMPTAIAISGSRIAHCGIAITTSSPARIPTDVQTSVSRCFASASIVMLSCVRAAFSITRAAAKFAAPAMNAMAIPGPEVHDRLRIDEAADRGDDDRDRRDQDQRALDAAREVFGLVVTVRVPLVGGTPGERDGAQRDQPGGEIDERLERVRPQAHGARDEIRGELERDRRERRRDRKHRHSAHRMHRRSPRSARGAPAARRAMLPRSGSRVVEQDQAPCRRAPSRDPQLGDNRGRSDESTANAGPLGHLLQGRRQLRRRRRLLAPRATARPRARARGDAVARRSGGRSRGSRPASIRRAPSQRVDGVTRAPLDGAACPDPRRRTSSSRPSAAAFPRTTRARMARGARAAARGSCSNT